MSIIYTSTLKDTRMNSVVTAIGTSGFLVIGDGTLAAPATGILAKIPLAATAGTVTTGVLTLSGLPLSVSATGTGTASKAQLWTSANAAIVTGMTVGTSGTDIVLGTAAINSGNTVTITAAAITHG